MVDKTNSNSWLTRGSHRIRVTAEYVDPSGHPSHAVTMCAPVDDTAGEYAVEKAVGRVFAAAMDALSADYLFSLTDAAARMIGHLPGIPYIFMIGAHAYENWNGITDFDDGFRVSVDPELFGADGLPAVRQVLDATNIVDWMGGDDGTVPFVTPVNPLCPGCDCPAGECTCPNCRDRNGSEVSH